MNESKITIYDYLTFGIIVIGSLVIGLFSAFRKNFNLTKDEFLTGNKKMPVIPVAMSLLGGCISAISLFGNATEIYLHGSQLTVNLIGALWGTIILRQAILPVLYNLKMLSIYEYIEMRFGSTILRKLVVFFVMLGQYFFLGACLYAPSLALAFAIQIPTEVSVIFMGSLCTLYITLGGVKSVVYTDVFQMLMMVASVAIMLGIACFDLQGIDQIFMTGIEGGRLDIFNLDLNPLVRHTFWSCQVLGLYFVTSSVGLSQPQFQRFISVKNLQQAQLLCTLFFPGLLLIWGLCYFSGLVAYAQYQHCDPLTSGQIEKADQILPYLVVDKLSVYPGFIGLFIAGVYGGALSTASSVANSTACNIWEDIFKNLPYFRNLDDRGETRVIKILSFLSGAMGILVGIFIGNSGTLFQTLYTVSGAMTGPTYALFTTGLFAPWTNSFGVSCGFVVSLAFNTWLTIGKFISGAGRDPNLSLLTDECPENLNFNNTLSIQNSTTVITEEKGFYDLSYCYIGALAHVNVFIVSTIVTCIFGGIKPSEVNPNTVNASCLRLYHWIYKKLNISNGEEKEKTGENNAVFDNKNCLELKL